MRLLVGGWIFGFIFIINLKHILQIDDRLYTEFPAFSTLNATLAVVVDKDFMKEHHESILNQFKTTLNDSIREHLHNGGLKIRYFTWSEVRLKKDILMSMTVMDCEKTWKFYENNKAATILLIAITNAICPRLPPTTVLMVTNVDQKTEFPQIIMDAKAQNILNWKSAVIIIDEELAQENADIIKSLMVENIMKDIDPTSIFLYKIVQGQQQNKQSAAIRQILQPFQHPADREYQFVIFSTIYSIIIEVAEHMGMFHVSNQWLIFVLQTAGKHFDPMEITQDLGEGTNIAFVINETRPDCSTGQLQMNCVIKELSVALLTSLSQLIVSEEAVHNEISDEEWEATRYTKEEKIQVLITLMSKYIKTDAHCIGCLKWRLLTALTWGKTQQNTYTKSQVSLSNKNANFEFVDIGYWTSILGFITSDLLFPHRKHYFRNITLNIITTHNPPWQILTKDRNGRIIEHRGIVMEILKTVSQMLNFTYRLYDVQTIATNQTSLKAQASQTYDDNDNMNELLGSLTYIIPQQVIDLIQTNKYFMAAVAATIDQANRKPFNYTIPISSQKYTFITRRPEEVSRLYLYIAPFKSQTWLAVIFSILLTSPILYILNRYTALDYVKVQGLCTLKNCYWYIYGAVLQQGGLYLPQTDSARILIGFWWIGVIVLITSYCGNLVAFLTFPRYQSNYNYLYQIFISNEFEQLGLRNGTLFEKYAKISEEEVYHKFLNNAIIYDSLEDENLAGIQKGERINIDWRINLQLIVQNEFNRDKTCKFNIAKENFLDEQIALIIPSNSPYYYLINQKLHHLYQMGFIERWHQINLPSINKCNSKNIVKEVVNHKVNLDDMQGCFLVLLLGTIASTLIILMECCRHHLHIREENMRKALFST